jgi:hypothetical protein
MFAIIAAILFAMALLCQLVTGIPHALVTDFALGGFLAVALHLASAGPFTWPWRRA